jgi:hypothetical protein
MSKSVPCSLPPALRSWLLLRLSPFLPSPQGLAQAWARLRSFLLDSYAATWAPPDLQIHRETPLAAAASPLRTLVVKARAAKEVSGAQVGCSLGHPRALLAAVTAAALRAPEQLAQLLQLERAEAREEAARDLHATLRVISVLARSRANRAVLVQLGGVLPALYGVLHAAATRMTTLAAVSALESSLQKIGPQLEIVRGVLKEAGAAAQAFLQRESRGGSVYSKALFRNF